MTLLALRPRVNRSFERLYRRHVADVYRYALAVLRSPRAAEDATQAAFLKAYVAFRRGERPNHPPRAWLIAIAHDACRERLGQSVSGSEAAPEDEIASAHDFSAPLGELPFAERLALEMRDLEGRSYAEIAAALGLTAPAAEILVFHGRRTLREQREGPLTCRQAEFAVSRRLDGRLPRREGAALRAHLRRCPDCETFARRQRAQRAAVRSVASIPLPVSLATFFGGAGTRVGARAAALLAIGALAGAAVLAGTGRLAARDESVAAVARSAGNARVAVAATADPSAARRRGAALAKARARSANPRPGNARKTRPQAASRPRAPAGKK